MPTWSSRASTRAGHQRNRDSIRSAASTAPFLEALEARDATALVAALDRHIRRAGAALVDDVREAGVGAA
jgi:DNA-binding GntR family transcriptional regulator